MHTIKVCRYCEEENPGWATICRGCQGSLAEAKIGSARRAIRIPRSMVVGLILCGAAFGLLWGLLQLGSGSLPGQPKTLRVLWHKFFVIRGHEHIVGDIQNRSKRTLTQVVATGEFFGEDGREREWATGPVSPPTLPPGASAHFVIEAPYNVEIDRSLFHFQTGDGQQVTFSR